jgi:hypothetical protein
MQSQPTTVILPATPVQAAEYFHLFVNRRAYVRQSHFPDKKSGRFYYYKACEGKSKQPLSIDIPTIQRHLEGRITTGLYAINPQTQTSKWIVIDADHDGARFDLLTLQLGFQQDGIETLLEQSRRGGHLWVLLAEPLPARLCRLYVLNVAHRLNIAVKRDTSDGIEVFPRQNELESGEFGNAIRGPLGIHRASMQRYWFEAAEPTLDAQFQLLRDVKRVTREHLDTITAGMEPIPTPSPPKPWVQLSTVGVQNQGFQILNHIPSAKRSGRNYVARCPACAKRGEDRRGTHLAISIVEPTMYHCWLGCTAGEIRAALGHPIRRKQAA